MKKIILFTIFFILIIPNCILASDEISTDDIMNSQQESLDINSFIKEADKYTKDVYEDIDMGELFSSAITGNIDNESIIKSLIRALRWRNI